MATLEGQTIVALGGTSGVGFGVAKGALLSLAAHVIVASSTQARVDSAVERLRTLISEKKLPGKVTGHVLDVKDFQALGTFFESVGEIDHLVFTSGGRGIIPGFKGIDLETLKRIVFPYCIQGYKAEHISYSYDKQLSGSSCSCSESKHKAWRINHAHPM